MNAFNFLCGPYGLMGVLAICAGLLLYVRQLFRLKVHGGAAGRRSVGTDEELLDGYTVMGKAKPDPGVTEVSADEFGFSPAVDSDQLGMLADVQAEIRELCQVLADKDGTKEDFFSMFGLIREQYPQLTGHPLRSSLEHFIREQVPFFLSVAELESLWD